MNKDELLRVLEESYKKGKLTNKEHIRLLEAIENNKATYKELNRLAEISGEALSKALITNLDSIAFAEVPLGTEFAKGAVAPMLHSAYDELADLSVKVQSAINAANNVGLKAVKPKIKPDKVDGIVKRLAEEPYQGIKWIIGEPVVNFVQNTVNDAVQANARTQYKVGIAVKIVRRSTGHCCDWCNEVAGTFQYPNVPKDVYKRHKFCRCSVEYESGTGKIQNVHTKKWKSKRSTSL